MNTLAHPTPPSAAAPPHAPATSPLELREARQLRDALRLLLRQEQSAMADFLLALSAFDRQRGWEPLGHATLFAFLRSELGLSPAPTFWRMTAARLLQRFPALIDPLRQGRLCLTTLAELDKVLTQANLDVVLPRFLGLSSREAKEVVAELQPREAPPLRAVVTSVATGFLRPGPVPVSLAAPVPSKVEPQGGPPSLEPVRDTDAESLWAPKVTDNRVAQSDPPRHDVEPLTADLRRLHVTVGRQFLQKLDAARDGLSHALPGATAEQVLEAALDLLLEKQARARGQVRRPRPVVPPPAPEAPAAVTPRTTGSDDVGAAPVHRRAGPREAIPAAIRRAVWERDGGRCAWPLDAGGRCGSTHRLELDHVVPWSRGGEATVDNLRLTCHRHNALAARQAFGPRCADRYAPAPPRPYGESTCP